MKKKLAMLMCTALLVAGIAIPPALAAEQHYPVSVEAYMEGDTPCIRKVYQLALSDDPSSIPTGDFERDGRLYHLLDMTRMNEVGVDTQPYTKTVNVALGGHNRGVNTYFGQIHTLKQGATITLTTKLGTRTYAVTSVEKVSETDTSGLAATSNNQITLYTCVRDERDFRWCVTGVELV